MILLTRNPLWWFIGLGVSLAISAVIYFAVVKPQVDTANKTTRDAIHQVAPQVGHAEDQASCLQRAGTDPAKVAACTK